ncbi:MAG: phytanoyl-CoA dioxygenase family protein [Planctomycetes bacterium]|nr:phytanoyl-CoA dioxygenase family protein [Planctomycetota bacterium]
MTWAIDRKLHWTDHYVEYGFAVIKNVVGDDFIKPAMEEVRRILGVGDQRPQEWVHKPIHMGTDGKNMPFLATVYDQPRVREAIKTMFGGDEAHISPTRAFQLFVTPYEADKPAKLADSGHLDFVHCPIPFIGSGTMFQVSLIDAEPFSGNLTIYPGTHKLIQKRLLEDRERTYPEFEEFLGLLKCEPYEFVAERGDMLFFHHLVGHNGNHGHAAGRTPRVVIHGQAQLDIWPREVDPVNPKFGPWERSHATHGKYRSPWDEYEWVMEHKAKKKAAAKATT